MLRDNGGKASGGLKRPDDDVKIYSGSAPVGKGRIRKDPSRSAHDCNIPVLPVIFIMLLTIVSERLLAGNYINSQNPYVSVVVAQLCTYLIPCAFYAAFAGKADRASTMKFAFPNKGTLGFAASCIPLLVFGCMLLRYAGYTYFGISPSGAVSAAGSRDFLYVFLSSALIPALCEELVLRGLVFSEYEKRIGCFGAYFATTVLFAFVHFDIGEFFTYIFAGLILGLALHITRSVFVPVVLHFVNNFICIYGDSFLRKVSAEKISPVFVSFILVVLFLISVYVTFEMLEYVLASRADKLVSHEDTEENEVLRLLPKKGEMGGKILKVVLCPAFLLALALYVLRVVLE